MRSRILLFLMVAAFWRRGAKETLAFTDSLFGTSAGRSACCRQRRNSPGTEHSPFSNPLSPSPSQPLLRRHMVAAPEQRHNLDSSDPFAVLGLDPYRGEPIDKKAIKRAYKLLARQYHPDVATSKESSEYERKWASEQFSKINAAYETLCRNLEKELASRPHMWNPSKRKPNRNSHGVYPNPGQHQSRWNNPNQDSPFGGYWVGANDFDLPKYDSVNYHRAASTNKGGDQETKEYWNSPKVNGPQESQYGSVSGEAFGGGHWVGADFHTKPRHDENSEEGETYGEETIFGDFFSGNFEDFFTGATGLDYTTTNKPEKQPYNETGEESETIFNDFAAKVGSVDLKPRESKKSQQVSTEVSEGTETIFHDFFSGEQEEEKAEESPQSNFDDSVKTSSPETVFTDFLNGLASDSGNGAAETPLDSDKSGASDPYEMYFATVNTVSNGDSNNKGTNNGDSNESTTSNGVSTAWEEYYAKANCNSAGKANSATEAESSTYDNSFDAANSATTEKGSEASKADGNHFWSMGNAAGAQSDSSCTAPDAANGIDQDSKVNDVPLGSNSMSDDLKEISFEDNGVNYGSDSEVTYGSSGAGYDDSNGQSNGFNGASYGSTNGAPSDSNGVDYTYTSGDSPDSYSSGASYDSNGATYQSNETPYQFSKPGTSTEYSSNGVRFDFANGGSNNGVSPSSGISSRTPSTTAGEPSVTPSVAASGPGTSYDSVNVAGSDYNGPETIVNDFVSGVTGAARSSGGGVFQDIVDVLKRNVEGNVGGSGYILGGDDPELNKLLHAGTVEEIGTELMDTEMVVTHLTSKSEDLDSEIARIQAELAANKKLSNKIALEQMEAECRARKVVVEEFLPRAQERMRSLQTRYQDLIEHLGPALGSQASYQPRPQGRVQGSSWRSNWPPSSRNGPQSSTSSSPHRGPHMSAQLSADAAARAREKRVKLLEVDDRFDRMIKDFEASRRGRFDSM